MCISFDESLNNRGWIRGDLLSVEGEDIAKPVKKSTLALPVILNRGAIGDILAEFFEKKSKGVVDEELKGESQVLRLRCRDRRSEKFRW
jgi:hypothetical protein